MSDFINNNEDNEMFDYESSRKADEWEYLNGGEYEKDLEKDLEQMFNGSGYSNPSISDIDNLLHGELTSKQVKSIRSFLIKEIMFFAEQDIREGIYDKFGEDIKVARGFLDLARCPECGSEDMENEEINKGSMPTGSKQVGDIMMSLTKCQCNNCNHEMHRITIGDEVINALNEYEIKKENSKYELSSVEEKQEMEDWVDNFVKALEQDYILPEDF